MSGQYTESDLRDAFREGWQERNRNPGMKRQTRGTLKNILGLHVRGDQDVNWVPDKRTYHNSIWANSKFRKSLPSSTTKGEG